MSTHSRRVEDLSDVELRNVVRRVRNILWPRNNPDAEWRVDTIEAVAQVLYEAGLRLADKPAR